nr:reverse transcriptase domain-containing protein [Tanacetum cinerariifolium]
MNEHCSAVILNKLPRKLGDPRKFLIPCEFSGMDECLALADLGASINLMPLSVCEGLSLPKLTPTCMTLELADRLVSKPIGIVKDVSFKFGVFHFPTDFMVVDFEPDPRFFPPSKTTNLRNEITRFQQRFDESFYEAWDRFNDLLRACPHHGFSELHQLDTFYNALNVNDQDSLNSAAG